MDPDGRAAECMLVLIGAHPRANWNSWASGVRDSARSWRELIVDIKQSGLEIGTP
jgi:hypothetical protein